MGQLFSSTEMRSRLGRGLKGLTAVSALLAFALLAPGSAAAVDIPDASPEQICGRVDYLTSQKRFDDALELITVARESVVPPGTLLCEQERLNAVYNRAIENTGLPEVPVTFGQSNLRTVCGLANRLTRTGHPAEALALIEDIREPVVTSSGVQGAEALALACEQARVNALAWHSEDALQEKTWVQQFGTTWTAAVDTLFKPLNGAWLAFLATVATLLVFARLLVFSRGMLMRTFPPALKGFIGICGVSLVVLVPFAWFIWVGKGGSPWNPVVILVAVALSGAGSWLISRYLASRLALKITTSAGVEGVTPLQPSEVMAHLALLGASPPEGVESTIATDVTALRQVVSPALPKSAAAAVLLTAVEGFLALTPWHATVSPLSNSAATITITRNGRAVKSLLVDAAALEIPPKGSDYHVAKLAASHLLVILSKHHRGFEALCGGTDGDSVGLQYIATSSFDGREHKDVHERLLATALGINHLNLPAKVAYQRSRFRFSTERGDLRRYMKWLWQQSNKFPPTDGPFDAKGEGSIDLHRRILLTFFTMYRNFMALPGGPEDANFISTQSRWVLAKRLVRLLDLDHSPEFRDLMRIRTRTVFENLPLPQSVMTQMDSWNIELDDAYSSPELAYNAACTQVRSLGGKIPSDDLLDDLLDLLEFSFASEKLKVWAQEDPELTALHTVQRFRTLVGKEPLKDFWVLDPFKNTKVKLQRVGIYRPDQLISLGTTSLTRYLRVPTPVAERMIGTCHLIRAARATASRDLQGLDLELVRALVQHGVSHPSDANWNVTSADGYDLVHGATEAVEKATWEIVGIPKLSNWLRRIVEQYDATPRA